MSAFDDTIAGMLPALQATFGDSVVYSRFEKDSQPVTGVVDLQEYEIFDANDLTTLVACHEWLFNVAELATAMADVLPIGETLEPRSGDMIKLEADDGTRSFEVSPLPGKATWEYVDGGGKGVLMLVRTKKLKA